MPTVASKHRSYMSATSPCATPRKQNRTGIESNQGRESSGVAFDAQHGTVVTVDVAVDVTVLVAVEVSSSMLEKGAKFKMKQM